MLPSLLLFKEVVVSKVLAHSIANHLVFRSIYRFESQLSPIWQQILISEWKRYHSLDQLTIFSFTLLQLEITHFPSTALLFYPERCFYTYIKGELKLGELYFWLLIIIISFIKQKCQFHSGFY